ncbi:unnamed protein product [Pylaiella littoralis]
MLGSLCNFQYILIFWFVCLWILGWSFESLFYHPCTSTRCVCVYVFFFCWLGCWVSSGIILRSTSKYPAFLSASQVGKCRVCELFLVSKCVVYKCALNSSCWSSKPNQTGSTPGSKVFVCMICMHTPLTGTRGWGLTLDWPSRARRICGEVFQLLIVFWVELHLQCSLIRAPANRNRQRRIVRLFTLAPGLVECFESGRSMPSAEVKQPFPPICFSVSQSPSRNFSRSR